MARSVKTVIAAARLRAAAKKPRQATGGRP